MVVATILTFSDLPADAPGLPLCIALSSNHRVGRILEAKYVSRAQLTGSSVPRLSQTMESVSNHHHHPRSLIKRQNSKHRKLDEFQ